MPGKDNKDKKTGAAFKQWMTKNHKTVEQLSHEMSVSIPFLRQLSSGVYSEKGLAKVEKYLSVKLRLEELNSGKAAEDLGGYLLEDQRALIGNFVFVRFSEEDGSIIEKYRTEIKWDETRPGLVLVAPSYGKQYSAYLTMPRGSSQIFMTSSPAGWARLMITSLLNKDRALYGVLLCTGNIYGSVYAPIITPIFMKKTDGIVEDYQKIADKGSRQYQLLRDELSVVLKKNYVTLRFPEVDK